MRICANVLISLHLVIASFAISISIALLISAAPAQAQDEIRYYDDAELAGLIWSDRNQQGIAVSILLGPEHARLTPERIVEVLSRDFEDAGFLAANVAFFFQHNDVGGHLGFIFVGGDGYGDGPLGMSELREGAKKAVSQLRFDQRLEECLARGEGASCAAR